MKIVRLGDIATIERKGISPDEISDGTTYVGLENIISGGEFDGVGPVSNGDLASTKFKFEDTHILYGKLRPYLAKIAVPTFAGICSTDILPIRVGAHADKNYVTHYLRQQSVVDQVNSMATGANLPRISPKALESVELPLPHLDEQRRIASILDKADGLRIKRRQALTHLDTLTQSIFHSMFGSGVPAQSQHPVVRMGDVLQSATYGSSEKAALSGDIPILRMGNLTYGGELDFKDLKYVEANQPDKYLLRDGDLLFNRTNSADLVGKTAMFRGSGPVAYAGYLVRLRTSEDLLPEYLTTFMNLSSTKRLLRNMAKSIVGMANINAKEVQSIRLPVPPLALQQPFATRVAAVERFKENHGKHLAELDTLFASLQHRAFKGEL